MSDPCLEYIVKNGDVKVCECEICKDTHGVDIITAILGKGEHAPNWLRFIVLDKHRQYSHNIMSYKEYTDSIYEIASVFHKLIYLF